MTFLPELQSAGTPMQKQIINFEGYSIAPFIEDGEMRDMLNLSSDQYPNLSQRHPRGCYMHNGSDIPYYLEPECMLVRNGKLAVITAVPLAPNFYYGYEVNESGKYVPKLYPDVEINVQYNYRPKHKMVAINKKICIWPEKIWFDTETGETGYLGYNYTSSTTATTTFVNDTTSVCTMTLPSDADLSGFTTQDVVDITFTSPPNVYTASSPIKEINGNVITFPADAFLSILPRFPSSGSYTFNGKVEIDRFVPDLDFVMESNNRLWGCHDNAICCCKLGDPTNWHYYQGLSVDSFEVEVGTDGKWTGCCSYSSHLLFFKENYIHKVYGNTPATYQTQQAECYGLEAGSEKSIAVINETVFYKSKIGIMAYSGALPEHITSNFGSKVYTNAVAGTDGAKYYVSMEEDANVSNGTAKSSLFVFDLDKKLWHKEDDLRPLQFAYLTNDQSNPDGGNRNQLLYIAKDRDCIYSINPYVPLRDEKYLPWMAELGPFDEIMENKKIYSKIKMRLKLEEKAEVTISIKYNDGEWQSIRHIYALDDRSIFVPIAPVRCDKFSLRLEGTGRCTVESIAREFRERSDR